MGPKGRRGAGMRTIVAATLLVLGLATPVFAACKVSLLPLAVTMAGPQPQILGNINGQPVRFLADSGAFFSMLSPAVTAQLKLPQRPGPNDLILRGVGGDVIPALATVRNLVLDGVKVANVEFLVGGGEVGQGAAGTLGQNFWHAHDAEYDLANGVIKIAHPTGCGRESLAYWATGGQAVSVIDLISLPGPLSGTYGYAMVNGARIKVQFDTGASASYLTFAAARRAGIDPEGPATTAGDLTQGIGRRLVRTRIAPVEKFQIGDETIEHTRLRLGDDSLPDTDMLLGADFFLSHRIYVANSEDKIYFTYNGGRVFALRPSTDLATAAGAVSVLPAAPNGPAPAGQAEEASQLARQGAAAMGRLDFPRAIADLTQAHILAPKEAGFLYQRALAHAQSQQPALAIADLDDALTLQPDDVDAHMLRAELRLGADHRDQAMEDLDAASTRLAPQADARFGLAELYSQADNYQAATRQFELWIKAHPDDGKLPLAFNGRCWIGAKSGQDLDLVLKACDAAVRRRPRDEDFLNSRAFVRLRMGDTRLAGADFAAALAVDPKLPWSLYGRGLVELKTGRTAQGEADLARARTLAPRLDAQARQFGLAPDGAPS